MNENMRSTKTFALIMEGVERDWLTLSDPAASDDDRLIAALRISHAQNAMPNCILPWMMDRLNGLEGVLGEDVDRLLGKMQTMLIDDILVGLGG